MPFPPVQALIAFISAILLAVAGVVAFPSLSSQGDSVSVGSSNRPPTAPINRDVAPLRTAPIPTTSNQRFNGTVIQGATISIGNSTCTLGFIEKVRGQLFGYTAAHCGEEGERVSLVVDNVRYEIGTIKRHTPQRLTGAGADVAVIDFDPSYDNLAFSNRFSGDSVMPFTDLKVTDRICMYSNQNDEVQCSDQFFYGVNPHIEGITRVQEFLEIYDIDHKHFNAVSFDYHGELGDSGGPVWVEGKGVIGVFVSIDTYEAISQDKGSAAHLGLAREALVLRNL